MSSIIKIENLSKSFQIRHEGKEKYTALRDVISNRVKHVFSGREKSSAQSTMEEFWALRDVNFEVKQGERIGIIGRNGAGKSTMLKILSRITEPTKGRIEIHGRVASLLEVGTGFHPELTGRENVFLNGAILGMSRTEIRSKFDEIVAFAEVEKFLDTPVKRYSSGMYVRLAFAVAAHLEPEILIVDEVLAVGDAQFQKKCLGKMEDVSKNQGRTVLFVSHNMGVVAQLCHRAIVLNKGQIDFNGDVPSAIDHYMDQQQKHSRYVAERKDKEIYIEYAELQDSEGNPCNHFVVNRKILLKFKIVVQSTLKTQARLSCTIQNKHGDFLSTFVEDLDAHFESDQMSREFVIQYPAGLLAPNAYAFRLAIFMGRGRVFDLLEMICPFTMVDEGGEMAVYEGAHYGYFPSHQQFIAL